MKKKMLAVLLSFCLAGAMLAGCASSGGGEEASGSADTAQQAAGTHTVVDSGGTEVVIPDNLESVMTFGSCGVINTLIETLGCGDMIANNMSPRFTSNEWQYVFAPQMADEPQLENASGEIDIEGVVAADPDLCVVMQAATAQTLRDNGLTVLYIDYGNGRSSDAVANAMTILGDALGVPEKAVEYNQYLADMVEKIEGVTADIPEDERLTVLYGNVAQFTNPHILSEWFIPAAGGISVTEDIHDTAQVTYTAEDLTEWNPDVIIMITDNSEELKANTQINSVNAIANDQMFTAPTVAHFITGSSEVPVGILWLAHRLYPEQYTYDELAEDIYYFYDTFMGYQMSDEEIADIINHE